MLLMNIFAKQTEKAEKNEIKAKENAEKSDETDRSVKNKATGKGEADSAGIFQKQGGC